MYKLALVKASDREEQVRRNLYKLALVKASDREEQVRRNLYKLALVKASDATDCTDTTFYTAVVVVCGAGGHFLYCSCCSVWCWWPLFILQLL